jgi:hypothetical protein
MPYSWSTPFLSLLEGTDKDVLQQIFTSVQGELVRLNERVRFLEEAMNPNVSKERKVY